MTAKRDGSQYDNSYVRYGWSGTLADYRATYGFTGWSYDNIVNYHAQVYGNAHQRYAHAMDSIETARAAREKLRMWLAYVNLMPWGGGGSFSCRAMAGVRGFAFKRVASVCAGKGATAPKGWIKEVSKKGGGTVFKDPNNPHNIIRQMPGNPKSPNVLQQNPYVKFMKEGKFYDVNGKALPNGNVPDAHIPFNQFNINNMPKF